MNSIDLDIRSVLLQTERNGRELTELKERMDSLCTSVNPKTQPEWLTLEEAAALKGVNFNTVKSNPLLRPGAGNPQMQRYCNGRLVFNYQQVVVPWISVTDDSLEEYLTKVCHVTAIPPKIQRLMQNAKTRIGGNKVG